MTASVATPEAPSVSPTQKWAITLTVMVVAFMQILDTSVTNVILPHLQGSLSAGLDEVPMAYKDIDEVMAAQRELVAPLARFDPRLVKMAPSGEPPED